jgi:hypothetical protein
MVIRAYIVAILAGLPLLAPEVWSGFRLAQSDVVLSVIAPTEQPLSVRSPGGVWAMLLALAWFGLAYRYRRVAVWEAALVVIGGAAVLARLGNAWLYAAAMVPPLARQLAIARPGLRAEVGAGIVSLTVAAATLAITRPPDLALGARAAAAASPPKQGAVLADWRWAGQLQHDLGAGSHVLAAGGLGSESSDFWLDYVRLIQGHERWPEELQQLNVDLLVLNSEQRPIANLVRTSTDWHVVYDADNALVAERAVR